MFSAVVSNQVYCETSVSPENFRAHLTLSIWTSCVDLVTWSEEETLSNLYGGNSVEVSDGEGFSIDITMVVEHCELWRTVRTNHPL